MIEHGLMKRPIHNTWDFTDDGREYLRAYPNVALWESGSVDGITSWKTDDEF